MAGSSVAYSYLAPEFNNNFSLYQVDKMLVKLDQIFCQTFLICLMPILIGKVIDGDVIKFKGEHMKTLKLNKQ